MPIKKIDQGASAALRQARSPSGEEALEEQPQPSKCDFEDRYPPAMTDRTEQWLLERPSRLNVPELLWPAFCHGYALAVKRFGLRPLRSPFASITSQEAYAMGAQGSVHSEKERKLFAAYLKGHCWDVGKWVKGGFDNQLGRMLFGVWRDRAALSETTVARIRQEVLDEVAAKLDRRVKTLEKRNKPAQAAEAHACANLIRAMKDK